MPSYIVVRRATEPVLHLCTDNTYRHDRVPVQAVEQNSLKVVASAHERVRYSDIATMIEP